MSNKYKIILILAICVFGILGLSFFWSTRVSTHQPVVSEVSAPEKKMEVVELLKNDIPTSTSSTTVIHDALPGSVDDQAYDKAIKSKNPDNCGKIASVVARNLCFSNLAQLIFKLEPCSEITDSDMKNDCLSMVKARLGIRNQDIRLCQEIDEEMQKNACIDNNQWSIAECRSLTNNNLLNRCQDKVYMLIASSTDNPSECAKISSNDLRGECIAIVKKISRPYEDSDKDGLDTLNEIIYSTDPYKPDTDGDGFSDGSEVTGGYNPLGFGYMDLEKNKQFVFCEEIMNKVVKDACLLLRDKRIERDDCERYDNMIIRGYCLSLKNK